MTFKSHKLNVTNCKRNRRSRSVFKEKQVILDVENLEIELIFKDLEEEKLKLLEEKGG